MAVGKAPGGTAGHTRRPATMEKLRSNPWVRVLAALMVAHNLLPLVGGAIGINLLCKDLLPEECAFAVSSAGARCVLEKVLDSAGELQAQCQTSSITADKHVEWIETDECLQACGLHRLTYGLSTDALLDNESTRKLCSSDCQDNCPNVARLHLELAADEGLFLPDLCQSLENERQAQIEAATAWDRSQKLEEADPWPKPSDENPWKGQSGGEPEGHSEGGWQTTSAPGPQPPGAVQSEWGPAPSPIPPSWEAAPSPVPVTPRGWDTHDHDDSHPGALHKHS